jgi:hypothetical protein
MIEREIKGLEREMRSKRTDRKDDRGDRGRTSLDSYDPRASLQNSGYEPTYRYNGTNGRGFTKGDSNLRNSRDPRLSDDFLRSSRDNLRFSGDNLRSSRENLRSSGDLRSSRDYLRSSNETLGGSGYNGLLEYSLKLGMG